MSNQSADQVAAVTLLDGSAVSVRRLRSTDIDAVCALYENLTDRERYFRFFTMHPAYLTPLATKLTEEDTSQYAIGAFDTDRLLGVASYMTCNDPEISEVALVVAHDQHLRGVGTALLRHLAHIARHHGIRRFVADILAANHPMLKVLSDAGWQHTRHTDGSVHHVEFDLADRRWWCVIQISMRLAGSLGG